jgi:AcrR family transcriptional regulator
MRLPKNKDSITDASIKLFCLKGFADTSIKEIADMAGVSPGNIYNYFKNKDDLFEYVFTMNFPGNHIELLLKGVSAGRSSDVIISTALENIVRYVNANSNFFKLTLIDANEFGGIHLKKLSGPFLKPIGEYLDPSSAGSLDLRRDINQIEITAFFSWLFYAIGITDNIIITNNDKNVRDITYKVLLKILQKGLRES